jgi:hypothetical protein
MKKPENVNFLEKYINVYSSLYLYKNSNSERLPLMFWKNPFDCGPDYRNESGSTIIPKPAADKQHHTTFTGQIGIFYIRHQDKCPVIVISNEIYNS